MTCIVGYVHKNKVYIGADSLGASNTDIVYRKDPKVFINQNFIIGFTSSFRMGQLLMSSYFNPPKKKPKQTDYDYMITTFIDHVRSLFANGGYIKKENQEEVGGIFLVGYKGNLYKIESDFQVEHRADNYNACGCGQDYALGVLYNLSNTAVSVEEKITKSLSAAAYFSGGVGGEFKILSL